MFVRTRRHWGRELRPLDWNWKTLQPWTRSRRLLQLPRGLSAVSSWTATAAAMAGQLPKHWRSWEEDISVLWMEEEVEGETGEQAPF